MLLVPPLVYEKPASLGPLMHMPVRERPAQAGT